MWELQSSERSFTTFAMRRVDCDAVRIHSCYRISSFLGNRGYICNLQRTLRCCFARLLSGMPSSSLSFFTDIPVNLDWFLLANLSAHARSQRCVLGRDRRDLPASLASSPGIGVGNRATCRYERPLLGA